jgi:phosphoribosylanthranilate isomerase
LISDAKNSLKRVRVKICGITTPEDADAAIKAGADALGFNGFLGSKRYIDLAKSSQWIKNLPPFITRVAVLVNPTLQQAEAISALPGIDQLQLHGEESAEMCALLSHKPFIKSFAATKEKLAHIEPYKTETVLLDTYVPGEFGGTGKLVDLELARLFVREKCNINVILSGGLNPQNVAHAIKHVGPYAVDVASGVEAEPRRKDFSLMRAFISEVQKVHLDESTI